MVGRAFVAKRRRRGQRIVHGKVLLVAEDGAQAARRLRVLEGAVQLVVQVGGRKGCTRPSAVSADGLTVAALAVHMGEAE